MKTTLKDMIQIEKKYQSMEDGVSILTQKIRENDAIKVVTNKFRLYLSEKGLSQIDSSVISDIIGFNMIILEEALVQKVEKSKINSINLEVLHDKSVKKEKIKDFKATVTMLSREYLRGKEEKELFSKVLDRMERKNLRKKSKIKKKK